jgi:hypothetical protein
VKLALLLAAAAHAASSARVVAPSSRVQAPAAFLSTAVPSVTAAAVRGAAGRPDAVAQALSQATAARPQPGGADSEILGRLAFDNLSLSGREPAVGGPGISAAHGTAAAWSAPSALGRWLPARAKKIKRVRPIAGQGLGEYKNGVNWGWVFIGGFTIFCFVGAASGGVSGAASAFFMVGLVGNLVALGATNVISNANRDKPLHPRNVKALEQGIQRLGAAGRAFDGLLKPSSLAREAKLRELAESPAAAIDPSGAFQAPWLADLAISETTPETLRLAIKALARTGAVDLVDALRAKLPSAWSSTLDAAATQAAAVVKEHAASIQAAAELSAATARRPSEEPDELLGKARAALAQLDARSGLDSRMRGAFVRERVAEYERARAGGAADEIGLAALALRRALLGPAVDLTAPPRP